MGVLREVVEADLPVFHEHERDPEASAMAAERSGAAGSRRRPSPSSSTSSVRPLHAEIVTTNVTFIRVFEKCGFTQVGAHVGADGIEDLVLELR